MKASGKAVVAAVQMSSGSDKTSNLRRAEDLIGVAKESGAQLVVLSETFNWRGKRSEQDLAAEPLEGPTLELMAKLARKHSLWLLAGSITEKIDGESRAYNTSVLLDPTGARVAAYRKIHLFDVELAGRVAFKESDGKMGGMEVVTAPTELGTIGLSVCYDVRFPELYRKMAFAGARIIAVPSAFTFPTGEAHWEVLLRARAIENQVYVIAAGQFGPNIYGFSDYGNSMIIDPWGRVLARASDQECVIAATVDFDYQDKIRRELPCLQHARLL